MEKYKGEVIRIIVSGGSNFDDYVLLRKELDIVKWNCGDFELVSGGAKGADALGERYAKENGLNITRFPYESNYGKAGGPIRNEKMAKYSDALMAFWDGESRWTKNMINLARREGLIVSICKY